MIRPLTLTDLPTLGRMKEPWTLSLDRQLTRPTTPQEIGRASLLPYEVSGVCTLVYQEGSLLAYVQTEAGADRDRWAVLHLGLDPQADLGALTALLEQLCYRAAEHGAGRVFSAVVDEAGVDLFRRAGFVAYADETLYRLRWRTPADERAPAPIPYAVALFDPPPTDQPDPVVFAAEVLGELGLGPRTIAVAPVGCSRASVCLSSLASQPFTEPVITASTPNNFPILAAVASSIAPVAANACSPNICCI